MIVKQSQLEREWPMELTPVERDQLIQEKYQRMYTWYQSQRQRQRQRQQQYDHTNRDHS